MPGPLLATHNAASLYPPWKGKATGRRLALIRDGSRPSGLATHNATLIPPSMVMDWPVM
jgi:hypothetical protein